jgi:hypothetical protein
MHNGHMCTHISIVKYRICFVYTYVWSVLLYFSKDLEKDRVEEI